MFFPETPLKRGWQSRNQPEGGFPALARNRIISDGLACPQKVFCGFGGVLANDNGPMDGLPLWVKKGR